MSYKIVCTTCKKAFNKGNNFEQSISLICPKCRQPMFFANQKFKPPRKEDKKEWEIIKALFEGGYDFKSFYQEIYPNNNFVQFPKKLGEVGVFLQAYRNKKN